MSFEIDWYLNFFNISWAREQDKLVLLVIFEDKKMATNVAKEIESWSEKFTRLTIIEKEDDEFAICCYEDPQISKSDKRIGLFITGMRQSTGYEYTKIIIEDKSTLLQIIYAEDFLDIKTHEEVSKLVPLRKCRIISEKDLKKQEFYYEKIASLTNKSDEDSKK
jgi:hypothetical protein